MSAAPSGSAVVLRFADLERLKHSPFGRYIRQFMTRRIEAWRFAGQVVMWVGAWYHQFWLIAAGAGTVIAPPRLNTGRWSATREHNLGVIHTLHSALRSLQEEKDFGFFVSCVFRY